MLFSARFFENFQNFCKEIIFETASGKDFPENLKDYKIIIHCGGCMLNEREVQSRREKAKAQNVPFTNYGTVIAHINGILDRSLNAIT